MMRVAVPDAAAIIAAVIATKARPIAISLAPDSLVSKLALVIGGSVVIALSAQLRIDLPFSPVPVTGQTFAVLLVGAALGSRLGLASVVAYLAEGGAGAPVFAGGTSGPAILIGPTGGYLAGFALAAFLVGRFAERGWDRQLATAVPAMLVGEVAIYALGLPWLARFVGGQVIAAGLAPFIVGDLYKLVLAAVALPVAWRIVGPR